MDILWQQIIIGAAIGGAILYLVWRYVQKRRNRNACGDCCCSQQANSSTSPPADSFRLN